jgi:hypothetical protein
VIFGPPADHQNEIHSKASEPEGFAAKNCVNTQLEDGSAASLDRDSIAQSGQAIAETAEDITK